MNADGEWNDSRETLFAELFLDYYRETGDPNYFERGVAALKSGFIMMYCPENPTVKRVWEKVYPWFGPEDYGFTMENYAHGGRTSAEGEGMGVFTIYDWGNGAAAEATMRILDHNGHVYVDRTRGQAFGIDRVRIRRSGQRWELVNETGRARSLRVVFDDGSVHNLQIKDKVLYPAPGAEGGTPPSSSIRPNTSNQCSVNSESLGCTALGRGWHALRLCEGRGLREHGCLSAVGTQTQAHHALRRLRACHPRFLALFRFTPDETRNFRKC